MRVLVGSAARHQAFDVEVSGDRTVVDGARGLPPPLFVLPNGGGLAYGAFTIDVPTRNYLLARIEEFDDPLTRGAAWITLWDQMLERRIRPVDFLEAVLRALPRETTEQNVQLVVGSLDELFWRFLPAADRTRLGAARGGRPSRGHQPIAVVVDEGDLLRCVPVNGYVAGRRPLPRARLAARGEDSRADAGGARRSIDGARSGRQIGSERRRDSQGAVRPIQQSRSEGAVRVRDAGALGGRVDAGPVLREHAERRPPPARALGHRGASIRESSAARRITRASTSGPDSICSSRSGGPATSSSRGTGWTRC